MSLTEVLEIDQHLKLRNNQRVIMYEIRNRPLNDDTGYEQINVKNNLQKKDIEQ